MFENLVWSIVEYYAYKYLKGFKPEELKIAWWRGDVVLTNIELNTEVFHN